jgi:DNA-binding transcriptional ArsR family regulator
MFNRPVDHRARAVHLSGMDKPVPHASDPTLDAIFAALSDGTRRAILTMLLEDDMAVTDVAEPFAMSLAAVSKHLTVLAEAGLIQQEKRGRVKWCKLDPDAMRRAVVWIQGFGQVEPMDFDAFERFLAAELTEAGSGAWPEAAHDETRADAPP